jgi:UDP-glucose 4-epimerase
MPSSGLQAFASEMERCTLPAFALVPELAARGVRYVFFSSGGTVYGQAGAGAELMSERHACRPVNLYGYSKWLFEEYLGLCARMHALQYLIIRPSNPYGPYQNPQKMQGFIAVAMYKLCKGEVIEVWGDGSVVRDYIFVTDMANAFAVLLAREVWNEVFNIGGGTGYSLLDVLASMEQVTRKKAKVIQKDSRSVDVSRIVLDVTKLKSVIDFQPKSLADGLNLYYGGLMNAATKF